MIGKVGITVRYLEMIEAGTRTPTLHVLGKIAKVLGVRTSALLGETPSEDHDGRSTRVWLSWNVRLSLTRQSQ